MVMQYLPRTGKGVAVLLALVGITVVWLITVTTPGLLLGAVIVAVVVYLLYVGGVNIHGWLTNLYR